MQNQSLFEIEGFEALANKLKQLPDKVKRREVLKIQRRVLAPAKQVYMSKLREIKVTGNLADSVAIKSVRSSAVNGNPVVNLLPSKSSKADGYYKFMVVSKGARLGSNRLGSRLGKNTVVNRIRNQVYSDNQSQLTDAYLGRMTKAIQRRIDKL